MALIIIDAFGMHFFFFKFLFRKVVNAQCLKKLRLYIGKQAKTLKLDIALPGELILKI